MEWNLALLLYLVLQFFAFFFVLVATPLDVFRFKDIRNFTRNMCATLWGFQLNCTSTKYDNSNDGLWRNCTSRRDRFRALQAFALISIFVYGLAFVLGVIQLFCCRWLRLVCLALNIVGVVTVLIIWIGMVVTFYKRDGQRCPGMNTVSTYGAGFALFLLAWILDIANIVILLLLSLFENSSETVSTVERKSQPGE
ncbi:Amastin surface glycoprotein, putative [Leishmania shawi]|uniref:Amastin surface glycoprotein n=1 Tax=Leishmania shawi TaxID=5680 RepID=A0ABR3E9Q2_9TRYP